MRVNRTIAAGNLPDYLLVTVYLGMVGCTMLSPTTSSTTYDEDLSIHRPRVTIDVPEEHQVEEVSEDVTPTQDQTAQIEAKLTEITSHNGTSATAPGYTIQVYSGTSREQASQAKSQVYKILPTSRPETKYEQPIYRVRVGEFINRLEAQNVYAELLKEFPEAIVIPSRINLN